ncbi:MAG: helix-hairpin-helix domain-containing protein [Candidatus Thorarchaeota archaeon]|jgi:DNA repair protein RadA
MTELEAVSGVGPAAAKKLREVYVTTAELLSVQNPVELQEKTKLGEGTVAKLIRNARELVGKFGFRSGLEIEQEMATKPRLKSGIPKVDEALMGGFEIGSILEFFGPARGGKTQWVSQLAVMAQLPSEQGGLEGRVLWLDSESSFKPWIIRANALRFGLDPDVALGNIGRAEIILSGQITEIFESIPQLCAEQNYKLVVIDSFTGLFRAEYTGLESLRIRQQDMNHILNQMRRTATATAAIFAYTNQVMAKISTYGGVANAPIGGHILSHASDYRFYTRRIKADQRRIELQDNAGLPEFSVDVNIGWGGFFPDAKTKKATEPDIVEYFEKRGWNTRFDKEPTAEEQEIVIAAETAEASDA